MDRSTWVALANNRKRRKGGVSPSEIPGLQLWLKADDGPDDPVDGQPVTTWSDKSGQGNDATQATALLKPIYQTNELNGKPIVRFDGVTQWLADATFVLAQPMTLFFVVRTAAANHVGNFIDGAGADRVIVGFDGTNGLRIFAGTVLGGGAFDTSAHVYSVIINGASSEAWKDGASIITGDAGANTFGAGGYHIGVAANELAQFLDGDMAEALVYDTALSSANRQAVESYLTSKYGI